MRRIWQVVIGMLCTALAGGTLLTAAMAEELTDGQFRRLHKQLQPEVDEPWRTIPWKITLLDAQQIAAQEQKPIFIWAMDGHPLGCT